MKTIYIGGGSGNAKKGGIKWKLYFFLIAFLVVTVSVLKVAAPTIVEKWINDKGARSSGFAFSIRDSELSLSHGQIVLNDVKIFNPKTDTKILEAPRVTIQLNLTDLLRSREKKISVSADSMEVVLSKDLTSEIHRIHELKKEGDLYLNLVEGKIAKLNLIQQKDDLSRTVVELNDVNVKVKEVTSLSINKKSEFSITSQLADGGKLNLAGKATESSGDTPWTITGSLKQVPADIFNKIAGDKLPFAFREQKLNAEITAHSEAGKVSGEILPDIKILNLIEEKPGIPTQVIARALTEELTFSLPFTLKDEITFQYADTFSKLKNYRKYAGSSAQNLPSEGLPSRPTKEKTSSFWPF